MFSVNDHPASTVDGRLPQCRSRFEICNVPVRCYFFVLVRVLLVWTLLVSSTAAQHNHELAAQWKRRELNKLSELIRNPQNKQSYLPGEAQARFDWLNQWKIGKLPEAPTLAQEHPKKRVEPIFESEQAASLRNKVQWESANENQRNIALLKEALEQFPADIAVEQTYLHWIDHPVRRKSHLQEVERSARHLLKSIAKLPSTETTKLAREFTLYRLARGLAYRELPDVVKRLPIEDPRQLDRELRWAYRELNSSAGPNRTEFILLDIRMLRRDYCFGKALQLVESYGATIELKWYLKKRRDLLKEMGWGWPRLEAAEIYAEKFPEEVAKEINAEKQRSEQSPPARGKK